MDGEGFQFKHVSKDDFDRTYKKIVRGRQKEKDDQQWINYVESIKENDSADLNPIKNITEKRHSKDLVYQCTKKQLNSQDSVNILSLYNPNDRNHLQGLRSRLFITFNEFSTVVKNELLPPVLKSTKKVHIKCDQQADMDYMTDLNSLFTEVKKESKNENVFKKLNKTNALLKNTFQTKLIQCYKLAIDSIKLCSKTLRAGVYNAIQSKMKQLIQIISALSFTTRKYLFGELFKKKKEESFDLVQHCKVLLQMLDEYGFEDIENDNYSSVHSVLHTFSKKAITKPRTQQFGTNSDRLSMYKEAKPLIGTKYAREWSKRQQSSKNNKRDDELLRNEIEKSCVSNQNIKTAIEEYSAFEDQTIILNKTDTESLFEDKANASYVFTNKKEIQTLSPEKLLITKLETANNVGFYIVNDNRSLIDTADIETETIKENPWKNFPIKDLNISPEGHLLLKVNHEEAKMIDLYKKQFKESKRPKKEMDMIFNVTESIKDDMLNEVLTKAIDGVIQMLIMEELRNSF